MRTIKILLLGFVCLFQVNGWCLNVVFEGVNACGKTTVIKELQSLLVEKKESFRSSEELSGSPVQNLFSYGNDFRLVDTRPFSTSVYESLLLGAHNSFKHGMVQGSNSINIFDRDFMTILAYQRVILQKDFGDEYIDFFEPFKKIVLWDLMPIKVIVYLSVPIEVSVERAMKRGRENPYNESEIDFLKNVKCYYEEKLIPEVRTMGIDILELDGMNDPKENADRVYDYIDHHR